MSTYIDIVLENPQYAVFTTISLIAILIANYSFFAKDDKYPLLNPKKPFEWSDTRVVKEFTENSKSLLAHARSLYGEKPYRLHTDLGKVLVIPPSWVHALRGKKELDFRIPVQEVSLTLLVLLIVTNLDRTLLNTFLDMRLSVFIPTCPLLLRNI